MLVAQTIAGLFYLANKICLAFAERSSQRKRKFRILAWTMYLIGLPAWVAIFISHRNWIAAAVEAGGGPAMLMGLIIAIRGKGKEPRWLNYFSSAAIVAGFSLSLHSFGGLTSLTQVLEVSLVLGYLVGTYNLARINPQGYYWFMAMNASNACLMAIEGFVWLTIQQVISLGFVIWARANARKGTG